MDDKPKAIDFLKRDLENQAEDLAANFEEPKTSGGLPLASETEASEKMRAAYHRVLSRLVPPFQRACALMRTNTEALILARLFRGWADDIEKDIERRHPELNLGALKALVAAEVRTGAKTL